MDEIKVKAKETIIDQFNTKRVIKNNEYKLLHVFEDTFSILDESNGELNLNKNYFYELEED